MKAVLLADVFPPLRSSGAVQLRDLSFQFAKECHEITVLVASPGLKAPWILEDIEGVQVLRLRTPATRDKGHVQRALGELLMPFAMLLNLWRSPLRSWRWDSVVWYSPTIFLGPLAGFLKWRNRCRAYLIVRDIFPEWAWDMGLLRSWPVYRFFKVVARYQYSVADVIGVQTAGNIGYFEHWQHHQWRKVEVLQNWLDKPAHARCSIRVNETLIAGRKVFVYAGNMGVAQGMDVLLELALCLRNRSDIGFLYVGRGSEAARLKTLAQEWGLDNTLFFDEIDSDEIPDLYAQCSVGIVALDPRHKSHNIPGKFLTYMQNGLPVLANVNAGNDLAAIIRSEQIGQVCESNRVEDLLQLVDRLLDQIEEDINLPERCCKLFKREFSVEKAVHQIVAALSC